MTIHSLVSYIPAAIVAGFLAGFGWTVGARVASKLLSLVHL